MMASLFSTVLEFSRGFAILATVLLAHVLFDRQPRAGQRGVALGACYALVGCLGMLTPIHLAPGFFFDLRASVLGLAVLFAGPLPALLAAACLAALRLGLGGGGAWIGVGAIAVAWLVAAGARRLLGARHRRLLLVVAIAEGTASACWLAAMLPTEVAPLQFEIGQGLAVTLCALLAGLALQLERERRAAELAALRARDVAERANDAKNVFLAHMSHELRTPLNAVIGFSESLQLEALARDPARVREYAAHIAKAGNHLRHVVSDLLDLSRIESGKLELEESDFEAREMIDSVVAAVTPQAEKAGLRLEIDCDLDGRIHGDLHRLAQVIINLAANAIEATREGFVKIGCSVGDGDEIRFTVSDTGSGMPPDQIPGLLRPFNQRGTALVRHKEGSVGIGLPLSRALVELHGGVLQIQSRLGSGTIATVILPNARRRAAAV